MVKTYFDLEEQIVNNYGVDYDMEGCEYEIDNICWHLIKILASNSKKHRRIIKVKFWLKNINIAELERLIYTKNDYDSTVLREISSYDSIVEIFTTASASGCYITRFWTDDDILHITFKQDFNIDNITPELTELLAKTIFQNYIDYVFDNI